MRDDTSFRKPLSGGRMFLTISDEQQAMLALQAAALPPLYAPHPVLTSIIELNGGFWDAPVRDGDKLSYSIVYPYLPGIRAYKYVEELFVYLASVGAQVEGLFGINDYGAWRLSPLEDEPTKLSRHHLDEKEYTNEEVTDLAKTLDHHWIAVHAYELRTYIPQASPLSVPLETLALDSTQKF